MNRKPGRARAFVFFRTIEPDRCVAPREIRLGLIPPYHCEPARERFARCYAFSLDSRRDALALKRSAEANGDSAGLKNAEHALKEASEQIDLLDLFRKNLQGFVRLYEFLSQIVPYDDSELEQLSAFAKCPHPLLRVDRLHEEVDIDELQLTHYRLSKRAEHELHLTSEVAGE